PTGREGEEEPCPICLESVDPTRRTTLECKHSFCAGCLGRAFLQKPVCPTCGRVYGVLRGTQPEGGRMEVSRTHSSLPGYEQYGTIVIRYSIPSGIQQEEHPSPGEPYSGASRRAFLPDCPEGRRVLRLLRKAFDQRLVFTVGQSTSTSRKNTVTWNDVHHKTSVHGGPTHYGYPDPDYLRRVEEELAAKGIRAS
uniref:E3 ubiquitin-protein ligase n=1 Tax=Tetraodon nigroviridis TaxID=99883 RepID=H3CAI3_TETNG